MKKLLKGFTLAEALITLAIIGVTASLAMPTLQTNSQRAQVAPALLKAINNIESANRLALQQNNVRTLDNLPVPGFNNVFVNSGIAYVNTVLLPLLGLTRIDNDENIQYRNNNQNYPHRFIFSSKDGIYYVVANNDLNMVNRQNSPVEYGGRQFSLHIDVNGPKGPNIMGRDLYRVAIDTKGEVLPIGSRVFARYSNMPLTWEQNCNSERINNVEFCAGSVVDNGRVIHF